MSLKDEVNAIDLRKFDLTRKYDDENIMDPYENVTWRDHVLLYSISLFFFLFLIWANFATLDEVTRGDGKVVPSSEVQIIQNLEGGIVEEFLVKEGDIVQPGQTILRMSNVQANSDFQANSQRYLGLKATVTRLRAEAEGLELKFDEDVLKGVLESVKTERAAFKVNREQYDRQQGILEQQLSQKKQEVTELIRRISDTKKVLKLSRDELAMIKPGVANGAVPKMELLQLERSMAEQRAEMNGLTLALPRTQAGVKEAQERLDEHSSSARAEARSELGDRIVEMNSIKETLSALGDRQSRTEIKSPVYGTIKDLKINTVGGVVRSGDDILEIVPLEDQLVVQVNVRPSDIAFLFPGQKAVVKITAYDFSIYGGLEGAVTDISADTIMDEQGESFYHVKVSTKETVLNFKGKDHKIIPGMTASVDVLTGEKTVMDYLLKPFKKAAQTALRER